MHETDAIREAEPDAADAAAVVGRAELLAVLAGLTDLGGPTSAKLSANALAELLERSTRLVGGQPVLSVPRLPDRIRLAVDAGMQAAFDSGLDTAHLDEERALHLLDLAERLAAAAPHDRAADGAPVPPPLVWHAPYGLLLPCLATGWVSTDRWLRPLDLSPISAGIDRALESAVASFPNWPNAPAGHEEAAVAVLWPQAEPPPPGTLGAHFALKRLARIAGLTYPPRSFVAVGQLDPHGVPVPLADQEVEELFAAASWWGMDVLLPGPHGWLLRETGGEVWSGERTWDSAAGLVWGEEWGKWRADAHAVELAARGWQFVPWDDSISSTPLPDTETQESSSLRLLVEQRARPVVLGGPPRSGKSTIVRLLATRLRETSQINRERLAARAATGAGPARGATPPAVWDVAVIRSNTHFLPDRENLLEVGQRALDKVATADANRRLLVLEDLYPTGDGDIDEVLSFVSQRLGSNVVAVCEYDSNARREWQTDRVAVVPAVVGPEKLEAFVRTMAAKHPLRVDVEAGLAAVRGERPVRDLCRLTNILSRRSEHSTSPSLNAELAERCAKLEDAELSTVAAVAAASLVRMPVSEQHLGGLSAQARAAVGIIFEPAGDGYRIQDGETCRTLLSLYQARLRPEGGVSCDDQRSRSLVDVMAGLLHTRFFCDLLGNADPALVPRLAVVRLHSDHLCRELLRWAGREIDGWLDMSEARDVAALAITLDTTLTEPVIRLALAAITDHARQRSPLPSVEAASLVLHCLHRHLAFVRHGALQDLLRWLGRQAERLFERRDGSPSQRLALLGALERMHDGELNRRVADLVVQVFDRLDPEQVEDYYLVLRAIELQRRANRFVDFDSAVVFPVDQEEAVQRLLQHEVDRHTPFEVIVAGMVLKQQYRLRTWDAMLDEYLPLFETAIGLSAPIAFANALNRLHSNSPYYSNALLKKANARSEFGFVPAVRRLLRDAGTSEAAAIVGAIARSHSGAARDVLYDRRRPNEGLAHDLLRSDLPRDAKGVGMLLSAVHGTDQLYAGTESFGGLLGEVLGREWVLGELRYDPRPSVKYYLLKGMWDAEVSFRDECLDRAVAVVAQDVHTSRTVWAARLALRIAEDTQMGEQFTDLLRAAVTPNEVYACMTALPVHSMAEYHRLGRILHPELADRFASEVVVADLAALLSPVRGPALADFCREVARTAADAGSAEVGQELVVALAGLDTPASFWSARLARARHGDEFAQMVSALRDVSADTARAAVEHLAGRNQKPDGTGEPDQVLQLLVRRAMFDSAPSAASMLASLEQAAGIGGDVYREVRDRHPFAMGVFSAELQMIQDPSQVLRVARAMSIVGVRRGDDWDRWTDPTVKKRLVPQFRGPRAVADLLMALTLWSPPDGLAAAETVNLDQLTARLRHGLPKDPDAAARLAAFLWQIGTGHGAVRILDALYDLPPEQLANSLTPGGMVRLVRLSRAAHPRLLAQIAPALGAVTVHRADSAPAQDVRRTLMEAGHIGFALKSAGRPITAEISDKGLLSNARAARRPGPLSWCLAWLPPTPPLVAARHHAIRRLFASAECCTVESFAALAVAAGAGESDRVNLPQEALEVMSWRELCVLYELASGDAGLRRLLNGQAELLDRRLSSDLARIDFAAWELRSARAQAAPRA